MNSLYLLKKRNNLSLYINLKLNNKYFYSFVNKYELIKNKNKYCKIKDDKENNLENINKNEYIENKYKNLIQSYRKLLTSKKIEKDPFQYNLILILQTLENNINYYYNYIEQNEKNKKSKKTRFFRFLYSETKEKKIIENEDTETNEEFLKNLKNDSSFFIFNEFVSVDYMKRFKYDNIKNEKDIIFYTENKDNIYSYIKYIRGIYLYGSVGRGKTFFLNLLFDNIKINKLKIHYHNFMQEVHKLFHEEKINNSLNPIEKISRKLNKKYKLIFIDEFQVVHISDAMILKSLLNYLFNLGTIILFSSNRHPFNLYHNGLNRERFLPFIKNLYKFNYIYEIDKYFDYRVKNKAFNSNIYNIPSKNIDDIIKLCKEMYKNTYNIKDEDINDIEYINKPIAISKYKNYIVPYRLKNYCIFSFDNLCKENVSINEYTVIANNYNTIFIYDIEKMNEHINGNEMRRFILLIDILYEKNIRVFFFSNIPIFQLFESSDIILYFQNFIDILKKNYNNFDEFISSFEDLFINNCFNEDIFIKILSKFNISLNIIKKIYHAIRFNISKDYIPTEYLRQVLCFHIQNYEINVEKHLKFLLNPNIQLEFSPYLIFDENIIDTSQENVFASMRTLSRIKHMSTLSYLEEHKKLYE